MRRSTAASRLALPLSFVLAAAGPGCVGTRDATAGTPASRPVPPRPNPHPLVVLMTDFGTRDDAAALLKGVVLSIARDALVVDLTHEVPRFDVAEGARILAEAPAVFPEGTVFVAVVDPGVGTSRKAIAIKLKNGRFLVGPDNGLLSLAAERSGVDEAREITDPRFRASAPSKTFHGRDVFAPAGAVLARGEVPFSDVGPLLGTWARLEVPLPATEGDAVRGIVVAIDDPYGNIWTNLTPKVLEGIGARRGDRLAFAFPSRTVNVRWVETFGDVPEGKPLAYVNSRGAIAVALNMGDAAKELSVKRGDVVRVTKAD